MKFGPVPVAQAEGAILAHSEHLAEHPEPRKLAKGTVLTAAHVEAMARSGMAQVVVARLEQGDVHEDAAALRLARAVQGEASGFETGSASTGRVNLRAAGPGIVSVAAEAILAANAVDPGITIATVAPWQRLDARGLAATIKIIPYAVRQAHLEQACAAAAGALRLTPPVLRSASLIETRIGADTPPGKGRRAMQARLERLGVSLSPRVVVAHDEAALADALRAVPGDLVLILTGSATSDLRDTAPAAVGRAGGRVLHYGMPVDPGNLLFLGEIGARCVIGLPGCARSPALNGADWVLERVICGVPVGPAQIAAMGVGGLLKEIPSRPRPRERRT